MSQNDASGRKISYWQRQSKPFRRAMKKVSTFLTYHIGAKLYLNSAMNKQKEADNLQKMAHKMDHL
jgi:hypothetical protein